MFSIPGMGFEKSGGFWPFWPIPKSGQGFNKQRVGFEYNNLGDPLLIKHGNGGLQPLGNPLLFFKLSIAMFDCRR